MIKKLQQTNNETAAEIRSVFQVSYAVEAKLLNAIDFPPLKRQLEDFINSETQFFGYLTNNELAGVVEIDHNTERTYIKSLVVAPKFFRQGIASQLLEFVFDTFDSNVFMVETGVANDPATTLYKKFGFKEVKQWDTDHGVRKVKFERNI